MWDAAVGVRASSRACSNAVRNVSGTSITLLCQDLVSPGSGDSGSPALQGRKLVGVLWGGNGAGTQFVYSPIAQIKSELGGFSVK